MTHSFFQNCCWITLRVSHHQGWKTCVKNGRHFSRHLQAIRNRDCWVFGKSLTLGVIWRVWWLDLTDPDPHILRHIYATRYVKCEIWRFSHRFSSVGDCTDESSTCSSVLCNAHQVWNGEASPFVFTLTALCPSSLDWGYRWAVQWNATEVFQFVRLDADE